MNDNHTITKNTKLNMNENHTITKNTELIEETPPVVEAHPSLKKAIVSIKAHPENGTEILRASERNIDTPTEDVCDKIFGRIIKRKAMAKSQVAEGDALVAISILIQQGGTSPSKPGKARIVIGDSYISMEEIREACSKHQVTVRQFARGIGSSIVEVLLALKEKAPAGNLAKQMKAEVPDLSAEEEVWVSDFNTYNLDCPERIRDWLQKNAQKRFR